MATRDTDYRDLLIHQLSVHVSYNLKRKIQIIAKRENLTVSETARLLLEKAVSKYTEVNANGN